MQCVIQRVLSASVSVSGQTIGAIGPGMLVLAAVTKTDTERDVQWTAAKLMGLRIFRNNGKHFDLDIKQAGGAILAVSNFTVAGQTRHGRRPSLDQAADPDTAQRLFDALVDAIRAAGVSVATGQFGADMQVHLVNDGPVTFIVNSSPAIQPTR